MPTTLPNIVAPSFFFFYSVIFGRYMRLKVKFAIRPNGLKIVEGVSTTLQNTMAPSFGRSDAVVTSSVDFGENLGLTKRADNRDVGATGMWYLHGNAVWTLRCGRRVYAKYRGRRVKSNAHKIKLSVKLKPEQTHCCVPK